MPNGYPVLVVDEADGATVTCPDIPEMVMCGDTVEDALAHAHDALVTALSIYVEDGRSIPDPQPAETLPVVRLSLVENLKLLFHNLIITLRAPDGELAEHLRVSLEELRRLRDPSEDSDPEIVISAMRQLLREQLPVLHAAA